MRRKAAYRLALEIALLAVMLFCVMPRRAYADTYVTDGGADKLDAIMEFLGYDPNEGTSTNNLKHAFTNAINDVSPYTGFDRFKLFYNAVYSLNNSPQPVIQYWADADGFQYANLLDGARADASEIRNIWLLNFEQGNGGGSGDVGVTGDVVDFNSYKTVWFVTQEYWTGVWYDGSIQPTSGTPAPLVVKVSKAKMDSIRSYLGNDFRACVTRFGVGFDNNNNNAPYIHNFRLFFFDNAATYQIDNNNGLNSGGYLVTWSKAYLSDGYAQINDGQIDFTSSNFTRNSGGSNTIAICYWSDIHYPSDGGGTTQDPDPTPPSDPPSSEPGEPSPTEPTYDIDVETNVYIIYEQVYYENTFPTYNSELEVLISIRNWVINTYNLIIRNANNITNKGFKSIVDLLMLIANNQIDFFQHVDDLFQHTWYVLTHLDNDTNVEVDDSNIVTWLQMIYGRLVQWPTTKPPIDNPSFTIGDILKWFADQWSKLIDALFGVTPTILQNLLGSLSDLSGKFPISIPWDLMALLALFQHAPVTPVFDIPLAWSASGSTPLHVDLTPYNDVASVVRTVILVMFAAGLAWMTPSMYKTLHDVGEVS